MPLTPGRPGGGRALARVARGGLKGRRRLKGHADGCVCVQTHTHSNHEGAVQHGGQMLRSNSSCSLRPGSSGTAG